MTATTMGSRMKITVSRVLPRSMARTMKKTAPASTGRELAQRAGLPSVSSSRIKTTAAPMGSAICQMRYSRSFQSPQQPITRNTMASAISTEGASARSRKNLQRSVFISKPPPPAAEIGEMFRHFNYSFYHIRHGSSSGRPKIPARMRRSHPARHIPPVGAAISRPRIRNHAQFTPVGDGVPDVPPIRTHPTASHPPVGDGVPDIPIA